jgi:hypothetical protein
MILSEAARIMSFDHFKDLEQSGKEGDRLGTLGATTYLCNNYTSPLHCDSDTVPGLCAQYHLQARKDLREYSFIYGDYRMYMVSRSNSLWYYSIFFQAFSYLLYCLQVFQWVNNARNPASLYFTFERRRHSRHSSSSSTSRWSWTTGIQRFTSNRKSEKQRSCC